MSKWHDDPFLWKTINDVLPDASNEICEKIYKEIEGTTWTISKIEKLAENYL